MRVFIHAPYLVNLGSPTPATYEKSVASVAHNLQAGRRDRRRGRRRAHRLVRRPERQRSERYAAAMRQVRDGPAAAAGGGRRTTTRPWLLLEPTAGQGRSLCAGVEDLAPYLAALDHHPKAGICLDTCHVFAAGAPLDEPGGATATVDRIVEIGGPGRLRLVHANDSMDVRGAFKDRHQKIGEGHIGADAFAELLAHPATDGVPFILETPGSRDAGDAGIPLLKRAAAAGDRARRTTLRRDRSRCSWSRPCGAARSS